MNWFIPKEHGAWAMLFVPLLLGTFLYEPNGYHLLFFMSITLLYMATSPFLVFIRKPKRRKEAQPAFLIYAVTGILLLVPVVIKFPFLFVFFIIVFPLFTLNIMFAKVKQERAFLNDVVAIVAFSLLLLMCTYIAVEEIPITAFIVAGLSIVFFIGSVFHVKVFIRERGNSSFLRWARVYHSIWIIGPLLVGLPVISLIFSFSFLKHWLMPVKQRFKPITIGIIEIGNSLFFLGAVLVFFS